MTRLLIGFSDFMVANWPGLAPRPTVGAIVAFALGWRPMPGATAGRPSTLRFPIAGKILQKAALARFARSFALGTRSGVPVMQALATWPRPWITALSPAHRRHAGQRRAGRSVLRAGIATAIFTPWCCR